MGDTSNTKDGWTYYSNFGKFNDSALHKVNSDRTQRIKLSGCNADNINIVGDWFYYYDVNIYDPNNAKGCRMKTNGTLKQPIKKRQN